MSDSSIKSWREDSSALEGKLTGSGLSLLPCYSPPTRSHHYFFVPDPAHSDSLPLSVQCAVTEHHRRGGLNNRHSLLTAMEAGSLRSGCQRGLVLGEGPPLGAEVAALSLYPHTVETKSSVPLSPYHLTMGAPPSCCLLYTSDAADDPRVV